MTSALSEPDPLARMTAVGHAYRQAALASPSLYGLMFGPRPHDLDVSPADQAAADATYQILVEAVRDNVAAGWLAGDPSRIALHLWSVAHGMVSLELAGARGVTPSEYDELYASSMAYAAQPFWAGPR
jgi:hypothetical protein